MKDAAEMKVFEERRQTLQLQVDFVLKKVKEMLDLYEPEIKPDTKEKIRQMVDKVLRIKSSTNLDYIHNSCQELLTFLQKEEIFLHEEARKSEHSEMNLAVKSMMMQLHKSKSGTISVKEKALNWRERHIIHNDRPSLSEKMIDSWLGIFIGKEENSEIQNLRRQIITLNEQLKEYFILYFQSNDPEFKVQARKGIRKLWHDKKNLKKELKAALKKEKNALKNQRNNTFTEQMMTEIFHFSGWLLGFYLVYYFVVNYWLEKDFGANLRIPSNIVASNPFFLKYFLATIFLVHAGLSIKTHFFRKNGTASVIIWPTIVISMVLIYLNF